jgi:hypothetical protein
LSLEPGRNSQEKEERKTGRGTELDVRPKVLFILGPPA